MTRLIKYLLVTGLFFSVPAGAETPIPADARWHQPYTTLLDVDFGVEGFHARWEYFHCGCGDILIRLEQAAPDGTLKGELMLVGGKVLLSRGLGPVATDLQPWAQAPSLMLQLAFNLLQRSVAQGPASVQDEVSIDFTEGNLPLVLETPLATGTFDAPWAVTGKTWKVGPGRLRFDMEFSFSVPQTDGTRLPEAIKFVGGQDYANDNFPIADGASLSDWRMQWISRDETESAEVPGDLTLEALREQAQNEPVTEAP